ncbi:hypothetical protein CCAL6883_08285 [Campylobacter sp. RM6883]|uniref:hypothetical protein n=1 Tax=Campylobacter californiensis TaxID=1032243 RepID=UPI001451A457|nr:hypothetical protein [Campylobacter sp. RM6914]MBE2985333.1 hypothetical protein [Campylobacter sp. RM6883]MBE2995866.1 hypothetical protein [Campylobacter sp. RM6913]QCD51244.1 hypothetical protein CCAL_1359 [Campylobacter sp. RM6914]
MKDQKNIELFDYYAGIIFARLIDEFPLPFNEKIADLLRNDIDFSDDTELTRHNNIIYYTVMWLRDNGFIKVDQCTRGVIVSAVLTHKGLEILKQVPQSIDGKSLGDNLKQAVKIGKDELIKTAVNKIFSVSLTSLQKLSENF